MALEIVVALIGGGAGLATGAIGSLVAPWANWGIEQRRLRRAIRLERISEWRSGVAVLRRAELEDGKSQRVAKRATLRDRITDPIEYVNVVPDPDLANVQTKPWYGTLRRELSGKTVRQIAALSAEPLQQRLSAVPDKLDEEINRLERDKWQLV